GGQTVQVCGSDGRSTCKDKSESSANLRLRLNPEIHISDNLRIMTQLDLLDNLVLGSTPESYAMQPVGTSSGATGGTTAHYPTGYQPVQYNGGYAPVNYAPLTAFSTTQGPPTAGVNGWTNSINVNRIWGEYMTPVGQVRFGRMPSNWGLGMVANSGDGIDSDYQTTVDRIMFITGLKSIDLYFGGAWDFVSTGPTNANPFDVYGGQPYNTCNLCNVNEYVAFIAHRTNPELQRHMLSHGDLVINGGIYTVYRSQYLDLVEPGNTPYTIDYTQADNGLQPRHAWAVVPDLWVQALWRKLRFEAEAVTIQGQLGYSALRQNLSNPVAVRQYGLATQTEFRAVDDKLDLQFGFGWASGDAYANN
ncbi:MAG: TIGR04551 family protein, partial [Polyangiaceae bacterium]